MISATFAVALVCYVSNARSLPTLPSTTNDVSLKGINQFSLRLLDNIASEQEGNFVVSPVSVWNLFALLAQFASGQTFDELMLQLNLPKKPELTKALFASADDILSTNNSHVTLQRLGSVYVDKDLKVHDDFCETAAKSYRTNVQEVDITNLMEVAKLINYNVCVATEGRIREAVNSEVLNGLRMVLIDAIFFKAKWTQAFDAKDTKEEDFYDDRGRKIGRVNMMYQKEKNPVAYIDEISAQALELTYGPDQRFNMIILLPYDGTPLKRLIKNLSTYSLEDLSNNLKKYRNQNNVDCYIPRFKISSNLDLKQPLKYLGLNDIFEEERASFPGISEAPLYVSKTLQKAEIEVTEEGTVAAASTIVGLEDRILGARVEVNKPFVYMITERESNLLLFAGVYNSPSLV